MNSRNFGLGREIVGARVATDDEHGVSAADAGVERVVNVGVGDAAVLESGESLLRFGAQIIEAAEFDGFRGTGSGTGWFQTDFLAVVAEGTFESAAILFIFFHHADRARHHTVAASVANVGLDEDPSKFGAHDCAGGAGFEAAGVSAVLADVR